LHVPVEMRVRCSGEALEVDVGQAALAFHLRGQDPKLGWGEVKYASTPLDLSEAVRRRVEGAAPAKGQGI
jgi:hypothetical protein